MMPDPGSHMAAAEQTKRAAHGRPHSRRHGRRRPATHVFSLCWQQSLGGRPSPAMTMKDEVRPEVIQLLLGSTQGLSGPR
jgi:hypothetical protein